jgi:hypothetical protein
VIITSGARPAASTGRLRWPTACGALAAIGGYLVARHYATAGLTLAHYDAKAHLVVARRIADSLTPGYQQIGAVWLPLPHLLNAIFVQYDPWFRSGASAVALSIAAFALAVFSAAALVDRATGSRSAATVAALGLALNPNLLYLQSTPMTEPLLLGMTLAAALLTLIWLEDARAEYPACVPGIALSLACLTRYEAWPVVAATLIAAGFALWRRARSAGTAVRRVRALAWYPAATIAGFLVHSRITVGEWFVRDFYTPDNRARHDPVEATKQILWGLAHLTTWHVAAAMAAAAVVVLAVALLSRRRAAWMLLVAPLGAVAVPWTAFFSGHPYRIRYLVPLAAFGAIPLAAATAALWPSGARWARWRPAAALVVAAGLVMSLRPLDSRAPMVLEAQWDRPNSDARRAVIGCLTRSFVRGEKIMASMGSLAPFMQESAAAGFGLNDYLHEGNGDIWLQALVAPRPYVEWILIQDYAEGGDMLARLARERPSFLEGFVRTCEGGGVVLYGRVPRAGDTPGPD